MSTRKFIIGYEYRSIAATPQPSICLVEAETLQDALRQATEAGTLYQGRPMRHPLWYAELPPMGGGGRAARAIRLQDAPAWVDAGAPDWSTPA